MDLNTEKWPSFRIRRTYNICFSISKAPRKAEG
jgi:hypothetical protein